MEVVKNCNRFNVVNCGRRWGKTALGQDVAAEMALAGFPVAWYAPTYKLLSEVWRNMSTQLQPYMRARNVQEKRLDLVSGGSIDMWTLDNEFAGRGRKYARIIVDEAAMVRNLSDVWNSSIRPTLTDFAGDAWFLSTPKGRNGFWQLYQRGNSEEDWAHWTFATSANPYIAPEEVDALKRSLPEQYYLQEIEAFFLEDAGGVFRRVMECATAQEQDAANGGQYIAGVDVATQVDFTVVTVLDVETKEMVYMDRFNRVDYTVLEDRLQALYHRFNLDNIIIESNGIGRPVIDALINRGLHVSSFTTTNATKDTAVRNLQAAFEHDQLKILADPTLISELQSFEQKRNASGSFSYSAPEGMHDDCVMSLALAWHGIVGAGNFFDYVRQQIHAS